MVINSQLKTTKMQKEQIKEIYGFTEKEFKIYEIGLAKGRLEGVECASKIFENAHQDSLSKFYRDQFLEATTPATEEEIRAKLLEDNWADEYFSKNKITEDARL